MMQRSIPRLVAAVFAGSALCHPAVAPAAEISEKTQYFAVHGSTLEEIDESLNEAGPMVTGSGRRHPGATSVQFDGHVGYQRMPAGCRIGETSIKLTLKTTLPKWVQPRRVEKRTQVIWRTLAADIARHEQRHSDIAINYSKRMESVLKNLRPEPTCEQMEAKANGVMGRYLAMHEKAQREFDIMEGREVDLRLRRAVQRSLRASR